VRDDHQTDLGKASLHFLQLATQMPSRLGDRTIVRIDERYGSDAMTRASADERFQHRRIGFKSVNHNDRSRSELRVLREPQAISAGPIVVGNMQPARQESALGAAQVANGPVKLDCDAVALERDVGQAELVQQNLRRTPTLTTIASIDHTIPEDASGMACCVSAV